MSSNSPIRENAPMPIDPELARQLRHTARLQERTRERRDALIHQASIRGGSLREIGALVGLSAAGVMKIVQKAGGVVEGPTSADTIRRARDAKWRADRAKPT